MTKEIRLFQLNQKQIDMFENLDHEPDLKHVNYDNFVDSLFKNIDGRNEQDALHAALGIAGEAGEAVDCVKKIWAYEQIGAKREESIENLVNELGDLRFYYQAMLNLLGLDDNDIINLNKSKLMKRYTDGHFTNEHANREREQ